ncbi:MAG: GxxExxY protein [Prevotella sp.]|nr:GxxExxY protein [Prevotella sp.]
MNRFKRYKDDVYQVIGAAMKVHSELKWGLLEAVYNEAMQIELSERHLSFEPEALVSCFYKKHLLKKRYKIDMYVENIIVELKSVQSIVPAHRAQLFNYMRLTKQPIGLLINFGNTMLQGERYGYIEETNECVLLDKDMNILREVVDWSSEE